MIGANRQGALVTLIAKVARKTAQAVSQVRIELLKPYQPWVKIITFDNGKEFAHHQIIDAALCSTTYFAQPYSSWQR